MQDICGAVGLPVAALFPARQGHNHPPERRPFDPLQVLTASVHEALTVLILAEDAHRAGYVSDLARERLWVACTRLQRGLDAVGELPESEAMRRIRRGEVRMPQVAG